MIIPVNFVKADHQCEWEEAAALGPATRSISIDKSSYRAGDTIYVSGTSCTDQAVVVQIFERDNGQKVWAQSVQPVACEDDFCYSTKFNTNYNQNYYRTFGYMITANYYFQSNWEEAAAASVIAQTSFGFVNEAAEAAAAEATAAEAAAEQKIAELEAQQKAAEERIAELEKESGGGCLIATAAFGSEMAPQVQFLRELRDNTVLQTESGSAFMTGFNQFYYSFSPAIADYERENPAFKEAVKLTLTPLLSSLTLLQYANIDSESEMLGYGIGVILLNIGMYFVAPAVLIMTVRKRI